MQDITGVPTGAAQRVYSAVEGLPHHYHFDNTTGTNGGADETVPHHYHFDNNGTDEDNANPNTAKKSRWGPPLNLKRKGGADTKKPAKKAAKKSTKKVKKRSKFHCVICDKDFSSTKALEQHKSTNRKHKKLLKLIEKEQRSAAKPFFHNRNDEVSPSMTSEQQHQEESNDDVSYYGQAGNVNWNESINDEQFHHTNLHDRMADVHDRMADDRIAEANRQWNEIQNSSPYTAGLQPDNCHSTNQSFQSDANQTQANAEHYALGYDESDDIQSIQTQENAEHYDQGNLESDVKIEEENDGKSNSNHSSDVSKVNGNLMKLTAGQSLQTRYPQCCQVIYSYKKDSNDSDETRVRIGKVQNVYIDMMSSSRQLAYEIKQNKSDTLEPNKSDTLVLVEEHLLAFAPQCPILFHNTPRGEAREEDEVLKGIVLASQWINTNPFGGDEKLSYTILLQHSTSDELIMKTNVSGENISYRSTSNRALEQRNR